MFVKLTRLDGVPIWLNASFIVTVEPRKNGGSIVVPIGDGLDYEVRETVEAVLALLDAAPTPTVVPVPAPKGLAKTPDDVSPETEPPELLPERSKDPSSSEHKDEPAIDVVSVTAPTDGVALNEKSELATATEKQAKKRTVRKTTTKVKAAAKPRKKATKKTPLAIDDEQVARLRKLCPRSIRKLANTLLAQFRVSDPFEVIRALTEREVIKTDGDRVIWPMDEGSAPTT